MIKVGYDAGHGLNTPGKRTPDGEREWTFNDKIARAFAIELSLYESVASKRFDDPSGKRDVPLKERTDGANNWGANYYISFHHNANTGKWGTWGGVETHIYNKTTNPKSIALANAIQPVLVKSYGLRDRGIKKSDLHITRETNCAAVLIEGGFMDSTTDIGALRNDTNLANAGKAIAQAFATLVGLKKPGEVKGASTTKGELTVGQYEDLKKEIADLKSQLKAQQLNDTGRYSCKELIKKAVADGTFKESHLAKLDKYTDGDLTSYALTYANNKID